MFDEVEKKLGYRFKNRQILEVAFTHTSYLNEHRDKGEADNEKLEFLGDAVLNLLISDYLYQMQGARGSSLLSPIPHGGGLHVCKIFKEIRG